jgi:hypothetical protein
VSPRTTPSATVAEIIACLTLPRVPPEVWQRIMHRTMRREVDHLIYPR